MTRPIPVAISARIAAVRLPLPGALYRLPHPRAWRMTSIDESVVREGIADRSVSLFDDLEPDTGYRLDVDGMDTFEFRTRSCTGIVDARDFGLRPDIDLADAAGARANTNALDAALAATPAGGTLWLGPGTWTAMPLGLRGGLTFHLSAGAVLRAPAVRASWPILPARDERDEMLGSWEGLPDRCFAAPVYAIDANAITIEGPGTIDGSGPDCDWWTWPKETREGARRPRGLHLIRCTDVTLLGFTIRNAPSWTVHPQGCSRLTAAGLTIEAPSDSPNTDGLNPEGCQDVTITGVRFSVGDDCIAIKAGKRGPNGEAEHLRETRNVDISNCLMEHGHGGVVIGSEMSGGVHDVLVEDCEMRGTDRGLRLKTRRGRGGAITGIAMRRVRMDGVLTALSANTYYHCDGDGHAEWVQSRAPADFGGSTPSIADITVEDVDIFNLAHAAGVFLGLPESPVRNVHISRLTIHSWDRDAKPAAPVMADHIRLMRHQAILAEHAEVDCDNPSLLSGGEISTPSTRAAS